MKNLQNKTIPSSATRSNTALNPAPFGRWTLRIKPRSAG